MPLVNIYIGDRYHILPRPYIQAEGPNVDILLQQLVRELFIVHRRSSPGRVDPTPRPIPLEKSGFPKFDHALDQYYRRKELPSYEQPSWEEPANLYPEVLWYQVVECSTGPTTSSSAIVQVVTFATSTTKDQDPIPKSS